MDIKVNKDTVIVFDLDDTLYNEIEYLKSAYRSIAADIDKANRNLLYRDMLALYRQGDNVFQYLSETYNIELKGLIETYRNHSPEIHLFEGVSEIFQNIKSKGGHLAIITDGRIKTQMAKIEALDIKDLFSEIVISEALGTEKPSQRNYKTIEASIPAKSYYYIADNIKKDFVSPNVMGWKTIGLIDNGLNIHYQVSENVSKEHMPHYLIESYREINIV